MKIKSIFNSDTTDDLPLYCEYPGQCQPQRAFLALDLENGTVDADYSSETGNGLPTDVFNDVVIRFYVDPALTVESICELIEQYTPQFQQLLDGSEVDFDFNANKRGSPINGDREAWFESINDLRHEIEISSYDLAIDIADYDTLASCIESYLTTSNLTDYAQSIIDGLHSNDYYIDPAFDDVDTVSRLIMECLFADASQLNANAMRMLLDNIDEYAPEIGVSPTSIEKEDIERALEIN